MEPNSGPGLVFISILTAFNQMEFGNFLGPIFFILLTIAALSSSISLLEPSVAYFAEKQILSRKSSAIAISLFAWTLGIGSALSFNLLSDFYIYDRNFLDFMDFIANQILLPLGGMLIAIFVGWFIPENLIKEETGDFALFKVWKFFIKFVAPTAVFIIFVSQFI